MKEESIFDETDDHQLLEDLNDFENEQKAKWEHEDLAKVEVLVFRGHLKGVNSCSFMNNDEMIISASDDHTVRIWNRQKQENVGVLTAHKGKVTCCRASFDGRRIASSGWDNSVIVWDTITGKPMWTGTHDGIVTTVDFSYDGKYIVTGNDLENAIRIWDAFDGQLIKLMKYHKNTVTCCRFSSMCYRFCSTSMDQTTHVVDMQNYRDDISPHGVLKVSGHGNIVSSGSFSGDDRRLCTASWDKTLQMWDVNAGAYRKEGPVVLSDGHEGSISSCKFSDDGTVLISSSYDQTVAIWDANLAFKKFALQGHVDWVTECDISKDKKLVVSSSKDGTLRLWNIERSEDIPVVLQNKLSIGLQMLQCQKCCKMFSISKAQDPDSFKFCVFCRLKEPVRPFSSEDFLDEVPSLLTVGENSI